VGTAADDGRDMRGGNVHTGYPNDAQDHGAELPLLDGARL